MSLEKFLVFFSRDISIGAIMIKVVNNVSGKTTQVTETYFKNHPTQFSLPKKKVVKRKKVEKKIEDVLKTGE